MINLLYVQLCKDSKGSVCAIKVRLPFLWQIAPTRSACGLDFTDILQRRDSTFCHFADAHFKSIYTISIKCGPFH